MGKPVNVSPPMRQIAAMTSAFAALPREPCGVVSACRWFPVLRLSHTGWLRRAGEGFGVPQIPGDPVGGEEHDRAGSEDAATATSALPDCCQYADPEVRAHRDQEQCHYQEPVHSLNVQGTCAAGPELD